METQGNQDRFEPETLHPHSTPIVLSSHSRWGGVGAGSGVWSQEIDWGLVLALQLVTEGGGQRH